MTLEEMAQLYNVDATTIWFWHKRGVIKSDKDDIYHRDRELARKLNNTFNNIQFRCTNPKDRKFRYYGGKGIKNLLTIDSLEYLWKRDSAETMKQPSIDRINANSDYTLENCRFIEMAENRKNRVYAR